MNKDNAHLYLPLVQALAEGKTIQFKPPFASTWRGAGEPEFTYAPDCYRIKPEPVELEVWYRDHDGAAIVTPPVRGEGRVMPVAPGYRKIKMREVTE